MWAPLKLQVLCEGCRDDEDEDVKSELPEFRVTCSSSLVDNFCVSSSFFVKFPIEHPLSHCKVTFPY